MWTGWAMAPVNFSMDAVDNPFMKNGQIAA